MSTVITAEMVIQKRQDALRLENNELAMELMELQKRVNDIQYRLAEIEVEETLLEKATQKNVYTYIKETVTVEVEPKHSKPETMNFDQALKDLLLNVGRPVRMKTIIEELTSYGFQWNNYQQAHYCVTRTGIAEPAGMRGMYQLRK